MEIGLKLAPIFGDGMILQRDRINRIYGEDTLAAAVTVCFMGAEYNCAVNEDHEFLIELPPVSAGGPYTMTVNGSSEITISDILIGDVYILSGQSNMELPLRRVLDVSAEEISKAYEPEIRQYLIPPSYNFREPEKYMYAGSWKKAVCPDIMEFSAAGYFFAKEIKEAYQIPVGLILSAVGGCAVESWMSPASLRRFGDYEQIIEAFKDINYFNKYIEEQRKAAEQWAASVREEEFRYPFDESFLDWPKCRVPSLVSDYGTEPFSGSVYLCREVTLDTEPSGKDVILYLGTMIDSDEIWINGQSVGKTDYRYPPRKYKVREGILKKGSNLITVRIVINNNNGGTVKGKPYYLYCNGEKLNLEGEWFYRIGKKADQPMPSVLFPPSLPVCFYNTVVAPLSKISIKGVLWYQGESNTAKPKEYSEKFAAMLSDWRGLSGWEIPFLYVQLANYREPLNSEEDTGWAELRDEQRLNLSLHKVAMAVALDIGEGNDLHPQNKMELGVRLAKAAKHLIYHENVTCSGPIPLTAYKLDYGVKIEFKHLEDAITQENLNHFEMADADGVYHKAKAIRRGRFVTVSCEEITAPVSVRYAWCDNPTDINFYNAAGLPAAGFRTGLLQN